MYLNFIRICLLVASRLTILTIIIVLLASNIVTH